jgi:hypothetical protein
MADHGADETSKSSSEERKKQMLKAKIVKSAKKKIEESEKVRAFATSCGRLLQNVCGTPVAACALLSERCGSCRTCKGVWGARATRSCSFFCASRHTRARRAGMKGDGCGAAAECQPVAGEIGTAPPIETGARGVRAR